MQDYSSSDYCSSCKNPKLYPDKPCMICGYNELGFIKVHDKKKNSSNKSWGIIEKLGLLLLIAVISISVYIFWFIPKTPEYALVQAISAIKEQDYDKFSIYVDVDSIAENLVNNQVDYMFKEDGNVLQSIFNSLFKPYVTSTVDMVKPQYKALFKQKIKNYVIDPNNRNIDTKNWDLSSISTWLYTKIPVYGRFIEVNKDNNNCKMVIEPKFSENRLYITLKRNYSQWIVTSYTFQ